MEFHSRIVSVAIVPSGVAWAWHAMGQRFDTRTLEIARSDLEDMEHE